VLALEKVRARAQVKVMVRIRVKAKKTANFPGREGVDEVEGGRGGCSPQP
jgi:hypothetical protein